MKKFFIIFSIIIFLGIILKSHTNIYTSDKTNHKVDCLYFKAIRIEKAQTKIRIKWGTLKEVNCSFYEVQKSVDKLEWETISKVEGQGNSNEITMYLTYDKNPVFPPKINYYRLKQIDFDGSSRFSDVIYCYLTLN